MEASRTAPTVESSDGAQSTRLRSLVEAGVALSSELSLDGLLQRLVEIAADSGRTRGYAALAFSMLGRVWRLERFVTHGIDAETRVAMGAPPEGRGILGVLLHDATPFRLADLTADPRSVGFPPHHPPMRSFLGVPILLRAATFGNLYLTEKAAGQQFTKEDEELVTLLAAQAAVAIENARLYEAATRWSATLESLNEVGNALSTETEIDRVLEIVVSRVRDLLGARFVGVLLPEGSDELRFAASGRGRTPDLEARQIDQPLGVEERPRALSATERTGRLRCSNDPEGGSGTSCGVCSAARAFGFR